MVKKKEKNESDRLTTSEWLKGNRRTHDIHILKRIIVESSSWKSETSPLDKLLFEKTYDLKPVPKATVSPDMLNRSLGYERVMDEITSRMRKVQPSGDSLEEQIKSLLPKDLPASEVESFCYAFSRIVLERIPKETRWDIVPIGLDALSAALLYLYIISNAVRQKIPWLLTIWKLKLKEVKIDAMKSIYDSMSKEASKDNIQESMQEADKNISDALGKDPTIDGFLPPQDPLSRKINDWVRLVSVTKSSDMKKQKSELRKEVKEIIADLLGYSATLATKINVHSTAVTNWNTLALRSDGPTAEAHEPLLRLIRGELNILRYDPIRKLCINLSSVEDPGHPILDDFNQVSDFTGTRIAYYEMHRIEPLLNECFIPTLRKLGLRYRYIFTPRQRPGVLSEGLVERMILAEKDIRGCTIHVEPNTSEGPNPRQFRKGSYEAVVEDEIVSLNLNHFDLESSDWLSNTQQEVPREKQKDSLLIQRSTISDDNEPFSLTSRQLEIIGFLWSLKGPRSQRKFILERANYPNQTAIRMLKEMLDDQVVRLLYLPALEFCSLPDGLIAYANCSDRRSRDRFVDHIIESQSFARIRIGDSNDVLAHIRVPLKNSDYVAGDLKEKIGEFSDHYFTARLRSTNTYKIATLHKLRKPKSRKWIDPWKGTI
ncbi:MAG: hypothetical protein KAU48_00735 [Candidatus Thorarchaeota archaeon]|nr:hypothetical protein [Candidatus Thorarchaeota archaeon]